MARPAQALISLSAIRNNYALAMELAPASKNLAVIKANAYGHGAVAIANELDDIVPAFGVACIEEAIELRQAGITKPILLLEGIFSADEVAIASEYNFWLMLDNNMQIKALINAKIDKPIKAWIKVDTGMHRLGHQPGIVKKIYKTLKASPNVQEKIVIATHFACGDELDNDFTLKQIDLLLHAAKGINAPLSMANSPGLLGWEESHAAWNRPGYMLYGCSPLPAAHPNTKKLQPAMTLQSAIIGIRDIAVGASVGYASSWTATRPSRIATVAIGYGDGYPRKAPSGTPVIVNGRRVHLVGRVSMDMISVDVTDLNHVKIGDKVTLWGKGLPVNEIAELCETIGYELITRMPLRTPRIYID